MALIPVANDQVAAVVTSLELTERPPLRPLPPSAMRLVHWKAPRAESYRTLFRRVGTPWLWFSRLLLSDDALTTILAEPSRAVHAVLDRAGIELGLLELDFSSRGEVEIAYFALVPELIGQGLGRWLMAETMARVWLPGIRRVWLRTCSLDHARALDFYQRQGFRPFKRELETFADPRALGILPRSSAPHIPLLAPL